MNQQANQDKQYRSTLLYTSIIVMAIGLALVAKALIMYFNSRS